MCAPIPVGSVAPRNPPVVSSTAETALRVVPPAARDRDQIAAELQPLLVGVAHRLCRTNPSRVDDLVQETLVRFMQSPRAPAGEVASARAWCVRVMTNLFIDECRANARRPVVDAAAQELPDAEGSGVAEWRMYSHDDLTRAVEQLPESFRGVYRAHLRGESYASIARGEGIKPATVGSRLHRARGLLRDLMRRARSETAHAKERGARHD